MSDCLRSSTHSALRKSPSPSSWWTPISSGSGTRLPLVSPSYSREIARSDPPLAEQVPLLTPIACGDQLLEADSFEVVAEIVKEVRDPRVVSVAVDDLAFEVVSVMPEFALDVGELRIELIPLRDLRVRKVSVVDSCRGSHNHPCSLPRPWLANPVIGADEQDTKERLDLWP